MGLYRDHLLPVLIDRTCGGAAFTPMRRSLAAPLSGTILELGFGSGLNLAHYPDTVAQVLAVEPSDRAFQLAQPRIAARGLRVERVGLDGQHLALEDQSVDGAMCTFVLCTIPDANKALRELARVLRPGAPLQLLEHGRAPEPSIARWQQRLDPLQRRLADGCQLSRDPLALLKAAGFELTEVHQRYLSPRSPFTFLTTATALAPHR